MYFIFRKSNDEYSSIFCDKKSQSANYIIDSNLKALVYHNYHLITLNIVKICSEKSQFSFTDE